MREGNDLVGEVLTFIDALLPEGSQNKAAKDTVKKLLWNGIGQIREDMQFGIGAGEDMWVEKPKVDPGSLPVSFG